MAQDPDKLPFDEPTLLYYLLFSTAVDQVKYSDDRLWPSLQIIRGTPTRFGFINIKGLRVMFDIDENLYRQTDQEGKIHDVYRGLQDFLKRSKDLDRAAGSFVTLDALLGFSPPIDSLKRIPGFERLTGISIHHFIDTKSRLNLYFTVSVNREDYRRVITNLILDLPKYFTVNDESEKLIFQHLKLGNIIVGLRPRPRPPTIETRVDLGPGADVDGDMAPATDHARQKIKFRSTPENNRKNDALLGNDQKELTVTVHGDQTRVSLVYWETYIEPWLHIPNILANRPNPQRTTQILDFWQQATGRRVTLQNLEQVILDEILIGQWNDEIWIPAQELLLA